MAKTPFCCRNGHIPLREPPCPGRQVGEGVSPTLDASVYFIRNFLFVKSDRFVRHERRSGRPIAKSKTVAQQKSEHIGRHEAAGGEHDSGGHRLPQRQGR